MAQGTETAATIKQNTAGQFVKKNLVWLVLVLLIIVSLSINPHFRKPLNLSNVLQQSVGMGIASLGQAFVVLAGGIDLSIGSMVSMFTTLIAGTFTNNPDASMFGVIIMILALGIAAGMVNALLVVHLNITPFIATLGMMSVLQGLALFYSKVPIGGVPSRFRFISNGMLGPIPFSILLFAALLLICYFLLNKHRFGRHLYAVGSNQYVSKLSGIPVKRVMLSAFTLCGLFAAVASIYLSARMAGGGPRIGEGYELDSITAIVIGGISLSGGKGSIVAGFGGVLILMVFNNIMNLENVNPFVQIVLKGALLILAVSFYKKKKA